MAKPVAKRAKDPRFILDGKDLYIHVDDLLAGMSSVAKVETLERAVAAISSWRNSRIPVRRKP